MSESNTVSSGNEDQGSANDQINNIEAKAKKADQLLAETKAAKEKARLESEARVKVEAELKELKEARLREEGKFKEIAEAREKEARESKEELNRFKLDNERKLFRMKAKALAMELGAKAEAVDDLVKVGDWSDCDLSNEETLDQKIKDSISRMKQSKPFYFGNTTKAPSDVNIAPGSSASNLGKPLHQLSHEEILELAKKSGL